MTRDFDNTVGRAIRGCHRVLRAVEEHTRDEAAPMITAIIRDELRMLRTWMLRLERERRRALQD